MSFDIIGLLLDKDLFYIIIRLRRYSLRKTEADGGDYDATAIVCSDIGHCFELSLHGRTRIEYGHKGARV